MINLISAIVSLSILTGSGTTAFNSVYSMNYQAEYEPAVPETPDDPDDMDTADQPDLEIVEISEYQEMIIDNDNCSITTIHHFSDDYGYDDYIADLERYFEEAFKTESDFDWIADGIQGRLNVDKQRAETLFYFPAMSFAASYEAGFVTPYADPLVCLGGYGSECLAKVYPKIWSFHNVEINDESGMIWNPIRISACSRIPNTLRTDFFSHPDWWLSGDMRLWTF